MKEIAVIIADLFEDSEYTRPVEAFQAAGHSVVNLGLSEGAKVKGKKNQTPVTIDQTVTNVVVDEFDALLIPGGYSPDKLRVDINVVDFVRQFVESGKPVFSIGHAPQLLISADVVSGRTITGWKSIVQDIKNAGATFLDEAVVEDGNLICSRYPGDLDVFTDACLKKLIAVKGR